MQQNVFNRSASSLLVCLCLFALGHLSIVLAEAKEECLDECPTPKQSQKGARSNDALKSPERHVASKHDEGASGGTVDDYECTVYLAESSIPNAGFGVFTGIDLKPGSKIGDPEMLLPIFDSSDKKDFWSLWHDFVWNDDIGDRIPFESSFYSDVVYPGLGAHINCHMGLNNVQKAAPKIDIAGLHRKRDAGSGAFTGYHSMQMEANKELLRGSELFIDYGENWFEDREDLLGVVPFNRDFIKADRILRQVKQGTNADDLDIVWDIIRDAADDRVRMALLKDPRKINYALKVGTARYSLPNFVRTPQWLNENGICVDVLFAGHSKIAQAGRGAFSKHAVSRGSVIVASPIIHLARRALPNYVFENQSKEAARQQLLLNYCFGHPKSSILFFPYAPIVNYINPSSDEPNAEIRWSTSPHSHVDWLSLSAEQLLQKKNGLLIDFVALRDISPGEEVLINYCSEWEEAWNMHIKKWTPVEDSQDYISATELNDQSNSIRTREEQIENPYPSNVATACYYKSTLLSWNTGDGMKARNTSVSWRQQNMDCLRPCSILSTELIDGIEHFTATMLNREKEYFEHCILPETETHTVERIPREAVTLVDMAYTSDVHLENAFRHEMGVPTGIFPSTWMDL